MRRRIARQITFLMPHLNQTKCARTSSSLFFLLMCALHFLSVSISLSVCVFACWQLRSGVWLRLSDSIVFYELFFLLSLLHPSAYTNQRVCVSRWRWKKNLVEHLKTFILYNGHLFIHNSGGMEKKCTQKNAKQWRKKKKKEFLFKVHTNTPIHYLTGVIFINGDYSNTTNVYSSKLLAALVDSPHHISQQYHNGNMPTCELSLYIFAVLLECVSATGRAGSHRERSTLGMDSTLRYHFDGNKMQTLEMP